MRGPLRLSEHGMIRSYSPWLCCNITPCQQSIFTSNLSFPGIFLATGEMFVESIQFWGWSSCLSISLQWLGGMTNGLLVNWYALGWIKQPVICGSATWKYCILFASSQPVWGGTIFNMSWFNTEPAAKSGAPALWMKGSVTRANTKCAIRLSTPSCMNMSLIYTRARMLKKAKPCQLITLWQ